MGGKTSRGHMSAATQQAPLDLKKQQVKYGHRSLHRQKAKAPVKSSRDGSGESMGKSDRARTAKEAARKVSASGASNGRAAAVQKTRLVTRRPKRGTGGLIILPEGYRPTESEPFMNERHKLYFRNKLLAWKEEIVRQNRETLLLLHE